MTEKGKAAVVAATLKAPRKFQCGDFVARKEPREDNPNASSFHLYKIVEVPLEHDDVSSDDRIRCQWFEPVESEHNRFRMTDKIWDGDTYTAKTMMWVDPDMAKVISGRIRNKSKCEVDIDLDTYCNTYFEATETEVPEIEVEEEDNVNDIDWTSLNLVLSRLPMFVETKSMLEEIMEKSGHILLLSSKYHAEVAGQGVEYCFGQTKWWYKKHNVAGTTDSLRDLSRRAFDKEVVTIAIYHARKFAQRARDYQRVYVPCRCQGFGS